MDARIQFRVDEETKRLAQLMAQSQGRTLSDACRELTQHLAEQQKQSMNHEAWLSEQIKAAFSKFDRGESNFIEHRQAKAQMQARKNKIRNK